MSPIPHSVEEHNDPFGDRKYGHNPHNHRRIREGGKEPAGNPSTRRQFLKNAFNFVGRGKKSQRRMKALHRVGGMDLIWILTTEKKMQRTAALIESLINTYERMGWNGPEKSYPHSTSIYGLESDLPERKSARTEQ
jgi:hypothetical protein